MATHLTVEEVVQLKKDYLSPAVSHNFATPPLFVRGEGEYMYDTEGRAYLDCCSGIAVVGAGHCNKSITDALVDQLRTLQHSSSLYLTEPVVKLAKKMAEIAPGKLAKSFFCNSGTEATEGAALMAKAYTGSSEFIALRHSYHGRSLFAASFMGQGKNRWAAPYMYGVSFAVNPYCYRCAFGLKHPECDLRCAKDIEQMIMSSTSGHLAGFIAETIQGNGGVVVPPPEYFKVVQDIMRRYGGLMIIDEVQAGMGRTGTGWYAIDHWGINPDIMTTAKGLGNGFPIGAFVVTPEVGAAIKPGQHFSTFGGSPMACAAALATIDYMETNKLIENANTVGTYFIGKLLELKDKHSLIGDVRGMGLIIGVELVLDNKAPAAKAAGAVVEKAKDKGLLFTKGGIYGNVLRLLPMLTISKSQVDEAVRIIDECVDEVERQK